jgi:hypothetical protein
VRLVCVWRFILDVPSARVGCCLVTRTTSLFTQLKKKRWWTDAVRRVFFFEAFCILHVEIKWKKNSPDNGGSGRVPQK